MSKQSAVSKKRKIRDGRVSLEVAASSGCKKCENELETGEKTKESHSNYCPRKMGGVIASKLSIEEGWNTMEIIPGKPKSCAKPSKNPSNDVQKCKKSDVSNAIKPQPTAQYQQPQKPPNILLPPGKDIHSAPAPEIGPGWIQKVARRKSSPKGRIDRTYISPGGRKCRGWGEVEKYFCRLGITSVPQIAGKPAVTFHCDKCGGNIGYSNAQTAGAEFAEHVSQCGKVTDRKNMQPSLDDETASDDNIASTFFIEYKGCERELKSGDRVLVRYLGQNWQARILRRNEKNGIPGYNIHFKGSKRKARKSRQDWVSIDEIVALQMKEDENKDNA